MIKVKSLYIIWVVLIASLYVSCRKDQWDKHNEITDSSLNINLLLEIKNNPDLSLFSEYLTKTGYDNVVASSKMFTVWAPTNEALKAIDQSYITDTAKLKLLIGNYIANQSYFTANATPSIRIKTLSGKVVIFSKTSLNDAPLSSADKKAKNGVLHTLSQAFTPELNIWEYLNANYEGSLQQLYLQSLQFGNVDPDSAELIGLDPKTGAPIYKPGTGIVLRNRYLQRVNLNNEDSVMTYVILTDGAWQNQLNQLLPYFQDTTQASTDSLAGWNIIKDLSFQGIYTPDQLPANMYSIKDSVLFHFDKSAIVKTVKVSNGIVYVMNKLDYDMTTKIKPVIVQGENYYDRMDPKVAISTRLRRNPNTDSLFRDILIQNYGLASFWVRYPTTLNSATYHVYWVAVNDFQTTTFPMMVGIKSHSDTAYANPAAISFDFKFLYLTVPQNNYNEVYLGDYTVGHYGLLDLFIVGNNVKTNGNNTIVLDYIKLVPVLN